MPAHQPLSFDFQPHMAEQQSKIFLLRALQKIVAETSKKSQFAALRTSCEEAQGAIQHFQIQIRNAARVTDSLFIPYQFKSRRTSSAAGWLCRLGWRLSLSIAHLTCRSDGASVGPETPMVPPKQGEITVHADKSGHSR